jgi:hypothetical protein
MSVGEYLERCDKGENITLQQVVDEGSHDEALSLFNGSRVDNSRNEIWWKQQDADAIIHDTSFRDIVSALEDKVGETISSIPILEGLYDNGAEKAQSKVTEIDNRYPDDRKREMLLRKQNRKNRLKTASEGTAATGLGIAAYGAQIGSIEAMSAGTSTALLGAWGTARYDAMEDIQKEAAAEALADHYGNYELEIKSTNP